MRLVAPNN
jgi:hypothetical protein